MRKKIKIIFFDIDGTLIDVQKKRITDRMLDTLKRLQENGIKICLATGRATVSLPDFEGVEFDAYLTFNGSYCYNREKEIFSNPIPTEDVRKVIANAAAMKKPVSIATKDRLAANGIDDDLVEYYDFAKLKVHVAEDFEKLLEEQIYQIMLGSREENYAQLMEGVENARITAWWDRAVDVIPADGGKGRGIEKVLEYYGLDKSEALAFGDGDNDIEMLQTVGTGIAMENASDRLKAIADGICGNVAEDGIYHYCVEQGLIN